MQKHVNLVDLVKSFPTNIFLQNLASIQKRTKNQRKVRYRTFQLRRELPQVDRSRRPVVRREQHLAGIPGGEEELEGSGHEAVGPVVLADTWPSISDLELCPYPFPGIRFRLPVCPFSFFRAICPFSRRKTLFPIIFRKMLHFGKIPKNFG